MISSVTLLDDDSSSCLAPRHPLRAEGCLSSSPFLLFFFPRPLHSLPKAAGATSFSTSRQSGVGSLGAPQPLLWQLRCRTGGSRQRPPVPCPSGVSAPFLLLLLWSPCSLGAALQQQEEEGRPWNSVGGMFCQVWRRSFLIGKKEEKKNYPSLTNLLASPAFAMLPVLISLSPRDFISFLWSVSEASVQPLPSFARRFGKQQGSAGAGNSSYLQKWATASQLLMPVLTSLPRWESGAATTSTQCKQSTSQCSTHYVCVCHSLGAVVCNVTGKRESQVGLGGD